MAIRIACPSCGRSGRVPEAAVGRVLLCPACGYRYHLTAEATVPEGLELLDEPEPARPAEPSDPRFGPLKKKADRPRAAEPEPAPAGDDDPYAWTAPTAPRMGGGGRSPVVPATVGGVALVAILMTAVILLSRARPTATAVQRPGAAPAPNAPATPTQVRNAPAGGRTLSAADVVAESDPSIALIRGKASSGTGFLVAPGLLATNAHVIDEEFVSNLEARFPAADGPRQGPFPVELVYEDARRDLAFLTVKTDLPALRVADSYAFRKGEEITVIGSPGLGDGVVLENAISRGVMSTRAKLDGQPFYQLGIAVNPGNSGGPVFDSSGRVIGVVTLKTEKQESLAFCVPVEDLRAALARRDGQSAADTEGVRSRHRVVHAVKGLGTGGALYSLGIDLRRAASAGGNSDPDRKAAAETFQVSLAGIEKVFLSTLIPEIPGVRSDPRVDGPVRVKVGEFADNFARLKSGYDRQGAVPGGELRAWKGTHKRLVVELSGDLGLDVPESLLLAFDDHNVPQAGSSPAYTFGSFAPPVFGHPRPTFPGRPTFGPGPPPGFPDHFGIPRPTFPTRPRIGPAR